MTPLPAEELLARGLSLRLEGRAGEAAEFLKAAGMAPEELRRVEEAWRLEGILHDVSAPPEADLSAGGFRPLLLLGEGSTGRIYLALQEGLRRLVCLKSLRPGAGSPVLGRRLRQEGRLLASLEHPHIIAIHGVVQHPVHGICLVLPYVRGIPLSHALAFIKDRPDSSVGALLGFVAERTTDVEAALPTEWRPPAPPPPSVPGGALVPFLAGVMERTAGALAAAHGRGLVHRDVKPSNILLSVSGEPVLLDFGLTRDGPRGDMTLAGDFLGTPLYVAPECVWRGSAQADARSDIYSLGASFYELFTGRPPFDGGSLRRTLELIEAGGPPRPRQFRPALPESLENILMRCLDRRPSARYPSAAALSADLRAFLAGRPVAASRRRTRPTRFFLMFTVLASLALAGAGLMSRMVEREMERVHLLLRSLSRPAVQLPVGRSASRRAPPPVKPSPRVSSVPEMPILPSASDRLPYADPQGLFALASPAGWRQERLLAPRSVGFREPAREMFLAARPLQNPTGAALAVFLEALEKTISGKPRFFGVPEPLTIRGRPALRRQFFAHGSAGEQIHILVLIDMGVETLLLDGWAVPDAFEACQRDMNVVLADLSLKS